MPLTTEDACDALMDVLKNGSGGNTDLMLELLEVFVAGVLREYPLSYAVDMTDSAMSWIAGLENRLGLPYEEEENEDDAA